MNELMMNMILFTARLHHAMQGMSVFYVIGNVLAAMLIGFVVISICTAGGRNTEIS